MSRPPAALVSEKETSPGSTSHTHLWRAAALCAGAAAALTVVFLFDPASAGFYPRCPFRLLTGLLCPGCGATRALHQLLHGRVGAALALNPLVPLYIAALGWVFLAQLALALGRPSFTIPRSGRSRLAAGSLAWTLLALVLFFWILRNLPGWPFGTGMS